MTTSLASYMACGTPDALHAIASFLGVFIGGVTFTGSLAAFRKLANLYRDSAMQLPYPGMLNKPIVGGNLIALGLMLAYPSLGSLMLW